MMSIFYPLNSLEAIVSLVNVAGRLCLWLHGVNFCENAANENVFQYQCVSSQHLKLRHQPS